MTTTTIAGRQVPVEDGPRTVVQFSTGCNPEDHVGEYDFWTMKNQARKLRVGRWPAGAEPGERFRRMQGVRGYEDAWADAQTAILVRPASAKEVVDWLNDRAHAGDAPCATHGTIQGQPMTVVKRAEGRYDLEPA